MFVKNRRKRIVGGVSLSRATIVFKICGQIDKKRN